MPSISTRMTSPTLRNCGGLKAAPNARGRAGGEDVAGLQEMRDLLPDVVEHLAGVPVLAHLTVHQQAQAQRVRVGHLVGRNRPGADGPVRVEALAQRHRRRADLPVAHRHVEHQGGGGLTMILDFEA